MRHGVSIALEGDLSLRYQTDYILRLIEQLSGLIHGAVERLGAKEVEEPVELAGQAIGLVLDMDPCVASRLSPQSLLSLVRISNLDNRIIEMVGQAIELEAAALEGQDTTTAEFRHEQAKALRSLLDEETAPTT